MSNLTFGPFTLNPRTRELRRDGEVIALPAKAFDLLAYMAAHPQRPLLKSELLSALWPDSFVEEANLNQNVFVLRRALGADGERLIVTLPRKGYQFTAEVTAVDAADTRALQAPAEGARHSHLVYEEEVEERILVRKSPGLILAIAAGVAVMVVVGWMGWQRWEDHVGGPPVQVVVAGFQGGTGDAVLDQALNTALRAGLSQSPYVTLVPAATVRQTLGMMTLKPDAELTPTVARDVCERTGSQAVLRGSVAQTGTQFLLTGEAVDCVDGSTLATFTEEAHNREALPHAVDKLAASLRRGLGESRRTIARFSQPLFSANGRTNSMEALEDYSQATVQSQAGHFPEATDLLKHAVALDPDFAVAWLDLSSFAANGNDHAATLTYLKKAYEVRAQAIAPVRYLIEAHYESDVQGDLLGAEQSYKAMVGLYPRSAVALSALGDVQRRLGQHAEAADTLSRALILAPNYAALYYGVCLEKMKAGLLDEARRACDSGIAHGLDSEIIRLALMKLAIAQHDTPLYAQQVVWAGEHHSALLLSTEAQGDLLQGHVHDAVDHIDRACALLEPERESVCTQYRFDLASELASMGETERAKALIAKRPQTLDADALATLAQIGDLQSAEAGLRSQDAQPQSSGSTDPTAKAVLRATIFLQEHRPADAIAALEPARPFEGAGLDSWYLRALAYADNGQHYKAAAEFQRIRTATNIDPSNIDGVLAELGLARSLRALHRKDEARQAYIRFLALWSTGDDELKLMAVARHELATLDL